MNFELENKIALVTGGTKGIGLSIATAFIKQGAKVIITARDEKTGAESASALGSNCRFIPCDVTQPEQVENVIREIENEHGRLDILMNNAGSAVGMATVDKMEYEDWKFTIETNLHSIFLMSKAALRLMIQQKYGRIINMSSIEGKKASPTYGHYTASKHAIIGLTKTLAQENGVNNITSNAICPGLVYTDLIRDSMEETAKAKGTTAKEYLSAYVQTSALKRPTELDEVAAICVFLASDASSGITGTAISVDGGDAIY